MESSTLSILRAIYWAQPVTRRELGAQSGLAATRVRTLVSQLITRGLVDEEVNPNGAPGRPEGSLYLRSDVGRVVGVEIGGGSMRAVLCGLGGTILASVERATQVVADRELILHNLVELVQEVCHGSRIEPKGLAALGVGVHAIIAQMTGDVLGWPNTPAWADAWTGVNLPRELGQRLPGPLVVVEDAACAIGTTAGRFGPARGSSNYLYVFLGEGIGSALFIDGRPYRGAAGLAGELGHVTLTENGPWCSCGNRGCLEVLASSTAVLRRVRERVNQLQNGKALRSILGRDDLTLQELIQAASDGDKIAFQILDETGTHIGKVIAIALNLVAPELVVLGGPLAQGASVILEAVRRQVRLHALQQISSRSRIVCDDQDALSAARGAALLALDTLFGSDRPLLEHVLNVP